MKKKVLAVLAAFALLLSVAIPFAGSAVSAKAACAQPLSVGNHTHYGGGGHSAGGGSTDFSGGSTDFSGGSSSFSGGGFGFGTVGIIVLIVLYIIYSQNKKHGGSGNGGEIFEQSTSQPPIAMDSAEHILSQIREHDPDFDSERFLAWSKQVFIQLQQAWEDRDWKKARPFESESLFVQHKTQLDEFIKNHTINKMENVCVNDAYFYEYKVEGKYEYLTVYMNTSYNDYMVDEETGKVVKGDPKVTYEVKYLAKFMRTVGVTTGQNSNASTTKCPNCGAPVDVNAAGECAYCGTVITNGDHDWVLCNLDDIQ